MSLVLTYLHIAVVWIWAHPEYTLPVVTGASSIAYTRLDKYPRWHAFFATLAGMGLDLPRIQAMIVKLITGKAPGAGSGGASNSDSVATVPPPPRMPGAMRRMLSVSGLAVFGLAAFAACGDVGCTKAQGVQIATVGVDTLICVLNHSTEPPAQIALTCGVADLEQISQILNAHHAAEIREHAAVVDAGSDVQ